MRRFLDITAAVLFAALSFLILNELTLEYDQSIAQWLQGQTQLDSLLRWMTHFGDTVTLLIVTLTVAAFIAWRTKQRRGAFAMMLAMGLAYIVNNALKYLFARERPQLSPLPVDPTSYSYPSGHAMISTAVYGCAAFLLSNIFPRYRWPIRFAAVLLVMIIGVSRVYLDAHWPSDVLAGFAVGWVLLSAVKSWSSRTKVDVPQDEQPSEQLN